MPPLHAKDARKVVKKSNAIVGPKSLHRGIHYNSNEAHVSTYKKNILSKVTAVKDNEKNSLNSVVQREKESQRELLVHHQKINQDLQDVYQRTANLHKDNMTLEERVEESWKQFERIGGRRPQPKISGSRIGQFSKHLENLSIIKKEERKQLDVERDTKGETYDYKTGSALHNAKDRRVKRFVAKQLKRAHTLKRFGDPTPLKQSGKFNPQAGTLNVFQKTIRQVKRQVANDAKFNSVKSSNHRRHSSSSKDKYSEGGKGSSRRRSMWDVDQRNSNINARSTGIMRNGNFSDDYLVGPIQKKRRKEKR